MIELVTNQPTTCFKACFSGYLQSRRILLVQSFTARMPLLMATSTFRLGQKNAGVLMNVIYTVSIPYDDGLGNDI